MKDSDLIKVIGKLESKIEGRGYTMQYSQQRVIECNLLLRLPEPETFIDIPPFWLLGRKHDDIADLPLKHNYI